MIYRPVDEVSLKYDFFKVTIHKSRLSMKLAPIKPKSSKSSRAEIEYTLWDLALYPTSYSLPLCILELCTVVL